MSYYLAYAAEELRNDIKRYGIVVKADNDMILRGDEAIQVRPNLSRKDCLAAIRRVIKKAKLVEEEKNIEKQVSLLGKERNEG